MIEIGFLTVNPRFINTLSGFMKGEI